MVIVHMHLAVTSLIPVSASGHLEGTQRFLQEASKNPMASSSSSTPPSGKRSAAHVDLTELPTPPKQPRTAPFEDGFPVEVRPLKFSMKADSDKAGKETGNYALWMNPTRKFNQKPGNGRPGFNNNAVVETTLPSAALCRPVK